MLIACDTHVHCYQFEQLPQLLDHAVKNFNRWVPSADAHVLFFTDGFVDRTWLKLQDVIQGDMQSGAWAFTMSSQSGLIEAKRDGLTMFLAPARQVNAAGRLEMLLLGRDKELVDKQPANELIEKYADDYVLVSPWGVGKWLGKRGRVLVDLINHSKKPFALGDNGGRPFFWPVPHFSFIRALSKGKSGKLVKKILPILNGTDPLPVAGEISRVGSYGVVFHSQEELSLASILTSLKSADNGNIDDVKNFGKPLGFFQFGIARMRMLLR